jgi:hypothetical protein
MGGYRGGQRTNAGFAGAVGSLLSSSKSPRANLACDWRHHDNCNSLNASFRSTGHTFGYLFIGNLDI